MPTPDKCLWIQQHWNLEPNPELCRHYSAILADIWYSELHQHYQQNGTGFFIFWQFEVSGELNIELPMNHGRKQNVPEYGFTTGRHAGSFFKIKIGAALFCFKQTHCSDQTHQIANSKCSYIWNLYLCFYMNIHYI